MINDKFLVISTVLAMAVSSASVWSSIDNIDEQEVLTQMQQDEIYIPQNSGAVVIPDNDPRASVPQVLADKLQFVSSSASGQ